MKTIIAAVVPLALAGCAQPFEPPTAASLTLAASPDGLRPAPSGPVVQHTARPITEPTDWRRLNDAQAPGGSS